MTRELPHSPVVLLESRTRDLAQRIVLTRALQPWVGQPEVGDRAATIQRHIDALQVLKHKLRHLNAMLAFRQRAGRSLPHSPAR